MTPPASPVQRTNLREKLYSGRTLKLHGTDAEGGGSGRGGGGEGEGVTNYIFGVTSKTQISKQSPRASKLPPRRRRRRRSTMEGCTA
jgi:hypothetical protein